MIGIGGPDRFAFEGGRGGVVPGVGVHVDVAGGIDAAGGVEAVALAGIEVVGAVGGCGVDRAGSLSAVT